MVPKCPQQQCRTVLVLKCLGSTVYRIKYREYRDIEGISRNDDSIIEVSIRFRYDIDNRIDLLFPFD